MCTSFASYYGNPIYGMNLDYPHVKMKLKIVRTELTKYVCFYVYAFGAYYPFAAMNKNGKFVNFQELHELNNEALEPPQTIINGLDLFLNYIEERTNINQIKSIDTTTTIIHPETFKMHSMFAEKDGNAVILECLKGKAVQRQISGHKIVMTNFSHVKYCDDENISPDCMGADRYLITNNLIEKEKDLLNVNKAFDILRSTFQTDGNYQTRCSIICDPVENEIYFVVSRNFNNIWKISLENELLENLTNTQKITIDENGIALNKLRPIVGTGATACRTEKGPT